MNQPNTVDLLQRAVESAIRHEVEQLVKVQIEAACEDIKKRIPDIVAGVTIRLAKRLSLEYRQEEILIHVKVDGLT